MESYRSPLLGTPGAVEADGPDVGVAAHYGSELREQAVLADGDGYVDLSHRDVLTIGGPDRLSWLHAISTQYVDSLAPGTSTTTLILSPTGHVEHVLYGVDDGQTLWVHTEPGAGQALSDWLRSMVFMSRVELEDVTAAYAIVWRPGPPPTGTLARSGEDSLGGHELFVPRGELAQQQGKPAGVWAYEALRIAAGAPRLGLDTDERAIPNELGWLGVAVHLDKGCYRGQETVARVHNLGRPPRRLVRLHLDGSVDRLPAHGDIVRGEGGKQVGFVGSAARHHELGPVALALVKRSVPADQTLEVVGGEDDPVVTAAQEPLVDPEVGLHVRARL